MVGKNYVYVNDFGGAGDPTMLSALESFTFSLVLILICNFWRTASGEGFFLSGEQENFGFAYEFKVSHASV